MPCFPKLQINADVQTTCGFLTTNMPSAGHLRVWFPPSQSLILKECVYSQGTNFKYWEAKQLRLNVTCETT